MSEYGPLNAPRELDRLLKQLHEVAWGLIPIPDQACVKIALPEGVPASTALLAWLSTRQYWVIDVPGACFLPTPGEGEEGSRLIVHRRDLTDAAGTLEQDLATLAERFALDVVLIARVAEQPRRIRTSSLPGDHRDALDEESLQHLRQFAHRLQTRELACVDRRPDTINGIRGLNALASMLQPARNKPSAP
ncbi:hypothetical protein IMZ29_14940 [Achromobacter sp. GG226]|uniref:hypothetical protein n=1 Tax=Verticiella alkaliphila TaxID=2779529 RepID=UPI001C0BC69D|nr:hypothetical protein [Verticiella sp. GG226]MBU4611784.1 hypothetical protein [Verticiella sp. GG226]